MFTYKKFINVLVFIISILLVNLVTDKITAYLLKYKSITHPAKATLIGMAITAFVLYPAFVWMDDATERFTKNYFNAGKNAVGRFLGVIITFLIALGILFLCYLHQWFGLFIWDLF